MFISEGRRAPVHFFRTGLDFPVGGSPGVRGSALAGWRAAASALHTLVRRRLPFLWHGDIIATSALAIRGNNFETIQM